MRCPECRAEVPEGARYCPACGIFLPPVETGEQDPVPIPGSETEPSVAGPCCRWHQPKDADNPDPADLPELAQPAFDPWPDMPPLHHMPYNRWCVAGLILGLVSVFMNLGFLCGIAAVLCSARGLRQARQRDESGSTFAAVGLAAGVFAIIVAVEMTAVTRFGGYHLVHHWIRLGALRTGLPLR